MCTVRTLWISCSNHFYLLNYVKPFSHPTSASLVLSRSVLPSLCRWWSHLLDINGATKQRPVVVMNAGHPCWKISISKTATTGIVRPNGYLEIKQERSVNKGALWRGGGVLAALRMSTKLSALCGAFYYFSLSVSLSAFLSTGQRDITA